MTSILYLLVKSDKSAFKIGITDNLESRHDRLRLFWGNFDLALSYTVSGSHKDIAKLEKTLHYMLEKWRIEFSIKADGHTEWFSMQCFGKALEVISLIDGIRGQLSSNKITQLITFSSKCITYKKTVNLKTKIHSNNNLNLAQIKELWPFYEKSTIAFIDNPEEGQWKWIVDINSCPIHPYDSLVFKQDNHCIILATACSVPKDNSGITDIFLCKHSLEAMRINEGFKEASEFLSDRLQKLSLIGAAGCDG